MIKTDRTFLGLPVYEDARIPPDAPIYFIKGEILRDQGIERAGSGQPVGVMVSWEERARYAIMQLCLADGNFCADDVRKAAGDPPTPNAMGGAFQAAYKLGLIVPAGFGLAHRPERHASVLRYWRRR